MRVIGVNTRRAVVAVVTVATAVRVRAEVADVAEVRAPTTARTYRALHSSDLGIHLDNEHTSKIAYICGRLRCYPTALHSNSSDHKMVRDILKKLGR